MACVTSQNQGFNKSGFTYSQYSSDIYECAQSMKYKAPEKIQQPYNSGVGGALGTGIAEGFARGEAKRKFYKTGEECMYAKGYVAGEITPEEFQKRRDASIQYAKKMKNGEKQ